MNKLKSVIVQNEDFVSCLSKEQQKFWSRDNKKGDKVFVDGITPNAVFWGFLGVKAFSLLSGLDPEPETFLQGGDPGYDFKLGKMLIDVKCNKFSSKFEHNQMSVFAGNDAYKIKPLRCNVLVAAYPKTIDFERAYGEVIIPGYWIVKDGSPLPDPKDPTKQIDFRQYKGSSWVNYHVPIHKDLKPIQDLLDIIKTKLEANNEKRTTI